VEAGVDQGASNQPVMVLLCVPGSDEPEAVYELGPSLLTGTAIESASAQLTQQGEWVALPVFRVGTDGIEAFNDAAAACFARRESCPVSRLAITLDGRVITAPIIQQDQFERDQIQISGGFTEESARDLAAILGSQALPVELRLAD
jgi:preprotein translocase subunit SecD